MAEIKMANEDNNGTTAVYDVICKSYNRISDFRAKLLALLPFATGAGIFLLFSDKMTGEAVPHLLPIGIFGAIITIGLFIYELRGIQECRALTKCAEAFERELLPEKLEDFGAFIFRPPALVSEGKTYAACIIYPATISAWIYAAGVGLFGVLQFNWENIIIFVLLPFVVIFGIGLCIDQLNDKRTEEYVENKNRQYIEEIEPVRVL